MSFTSNSSNIYYWCDLKYEVYAYYVFHVMVYDAEGEKREGEARENSSQQANYGGDVRGENQINQEGEQGKDFHGKVEGLSSDNKPEGGDPPVAEQTLDDKGLFAILLLNLT